MLSRKERQSGQVMSACNMDINVVNESSLGRLISSWKNTGMIGGGES
jgi:hypothetical protein